jgi:hypothetical protein
MKKIIYSLAMIFTLTACSLNDVIALIVTPTVSPPPANTSLEPTVYSTPTETLTSTPISTFTSTPTLVGGGDSFDVPTEASTALPTLVLVPTATTGPKTSLFSQPGSIILSIALSNDTLYWGYCDAPKYVDVDVRVANSLRVKYVLLFLRLVDKGGNQSTPWGAGAIMEDVGRSYYTYHLTPKNLSHYDEFKDAWIEYQVIASTASLKILESSPTYPDSLSLKQCVPVEVDE